jgi:hypothetical protein
MAVRKSIRPSDQRSFWAVSVAQPDMAVPFTSMLA